MEEQDPDDSDFEIQFYEGILQRKNDFIQALIAIGDLYTKKGLYDQGLAVDQKLSRLRPDDPFIHYNLACSYSLLNKMDEALLTIQKAVALGYDNPKFLEKDPDLANLRQDKRFQRYWAGMKKRFKGNEGYEKKTA